MQNQDAVSKYLGLCQHYSRQVDEELEQEDFLPAGEKAWGFLAAQVKAVAAQRGWQHDQHPLLGVIAAQLSDEQNRPDWHNAFVVAEGLQRNFYEEHLDPNQVRRGVELAKWLARQLEEASTEGPPEGFLPNELRQLRLSFLNGEITLGQYDGRRASLLRGR